jgi:hypothetical protein
MSRCDALASELRLVKILSALDVPKPFRPWFQKAAAAAQALWAERWRRRKATGDMIIVRDADDIVVGFEQETDARRFWDAMRDRLQDFSLSLHSKKTRLIEFGRHAANNRKQRRLGKPETFLALAAEDAPPNALPPLPSPPMSSATSYDLPPLPLGGEGKTVFAVVIVGALIITASLVYAGGLSVGIGVWITATLTVILGGIFCVD